MRTVLANLALTLAAVAFLIRVLPQLRRPRERRQVMLTRDPRAP